MTTKDTEAKTETSHNDEEETIRGTHSTARLSIWIALVIVTIALIGFLTSRGSFKAEDVAAGITTISADLGAYLAASGYEGEFSYESLALEGSVFSRRAVINQPEFTLRNTQSGEEMHITTERLVVDPDNASLESFDMMLEKPLQISWGEADYRIIQELPVTIAVNRKEGKESKSIEYASTYKEGMSFIVQKVDTDVSYHLHVGVGSAVKGVLDLAEESYFEESDIKDASLEFAQSILKLDSLKMVYEVAGHDNSRFRHYKANGEGVNFVGPYQPLGTFAVALEMEEELPLAASALERRVSLNRFEVKGEDYALNGEGQLAFKGSELLPYGTLDAEISSLKELLARLGNAHIVPEGSVPLIEGVIRKAATRTEDAKEMQLHLQRSPGGAFMIGDNTFEELAVSLLRDMVQGVPAEEASPMLTPEAEPEAMPQEEASPADAEETQQEDAAPAPDEMSKPLEGEQPKNAEPASKPHKIRSDAEAMQKVQELLETLKKRKAEKAAAEAAQDSVPSAEMEAPETKTAPQEMDIAPPSEEVKPEPQAPESVEEPSQTAPEKEAQ